MFCGCSSFQHFEKPEYFLIPFFSFKWFSKLWIIIKGAYSWKFRGVFLKFMPKFLGGRGAESMHFGQSLKRGVILFWCFIEFKLTSFFFETPLDGSFIIPALSHRCIYVFHLQTDDQPFWQSSFEAAFPVDWQIALVVADVGQVAVKQIQWKMMLSRDLKLIVFINYYSFYDTVHRSLFRSYV